MSLVAPRPERPEFIREMEKRLPYYKVCHAVLPGITGLAQINYGYGASVGNTLLKMSMIYST